MRVSLVIPGDPRGKGRPRFSVIKGHARPYTDAKTREYEALVAAAARSVMAGRAPLSEACWVTVDAYFTPPKSATKAQRAAMLGDQVRPVTKFDVDNIAKAVLDGLNGILFIDDRQVCGLAVTKRYDDFARVEVTAGEYGSE